MKRINTKDVLKAREGFEAVYDVDPVSADHYYSYKNQSESEVESEDSAVYGEYCRQVADYS